MSHDEGQVCRCMATHSPAPLELEKHHVWPLGMGGPDEESNRVWICPTTHTNTHELLRLMVHADRELGWGEIHELEDRRPISRYAWHLAVRGWRAYRDGTTG